MKKISSGHLVLHDTNTKWFVPLVHDNGTGKHVWPRQQSSKSRALPSLVTFKRYSVYSIITGSAYGNTLVSCRPTCKHFVCFMPSTWYQIYITLQCTAVIAHPKGRGSPKAVFFFVRRLFQIVEVPPINKTTDPGFSRKMPSAGAVPHRRDKTEKNNRLDGCYQGLLRSEVASDRTSSRLVSNEHVINPSYVAEHTSRWRFGGSV